MDHTSNNQFACPMHCEGDKVYQKPGVCPVCNMHLVPVDETGTKKKVSSDSDKHDHAHDHSRHDHPIQHAVTSGKYYCSMRCEGDKTYDKPGDCPKCGMHLNKEESVSTSKVIYTCPMHPEVKQDHPGNCPKCGMTLVPEKGVETSEEELAYLKMARKFWIAFALSIPVLFIAMSDFISFVNLEKLASKNTLGWIEFILATPVVFYSSWDFFKRGWSSIRRWAPNMWTLVSIQCFCYVNAISVPFSV